MQANETLDAVDELIERIDRLHSGPRVAQRIVALTREPEFDMRRVVECLEHDPALSARILSVVNSSRYGLAHDVSSVRHAATFLGRRSLRLIVLTFSLVDNLAKGPHGGLYADYWRRALTMAHVASRLSQTSRDIPDDEAYTSGLLADVGVLVLAQLEGERYRTLYERCPHGPALLSGEQTVLGFAHPQLGARLLERWQLPAAVVSAVLTHHDTDTDLPRLNLAVRAGDLMADALWVPDSSKVPATKALLETHFGFDLDRFIDLALSCRQDIEQSAHAFGISVGNSDAYEHVMCEAQRLFCEASIDAALEMDSLEMAIDQIGD